MKHAMVLSLLAADGQMGGSHTDRGIGIGRVTNRDRAQAQPDGAEPLGDKHSKQSDTSAEELTRIEARIDSGALGGAPSEWHNGVASGAYQVSLSGSLCIPVSQSPSVTLSVGVSLCVCPSALRVRFHGQ